MAGVHYDEVRPAVHINVDLPSVSKKHYLDLSTLTTNLPTHKGNIRFQRYNKVHSMLTALKKGINPTVHFDDPLNKVSALQDVLEILCYEQLMNDVLIESSFYSRFLQLRGHELLIIIMLYDFQKHKFCQRPPRSSEIVPDIMRTISESLWTHRVKLSATLARMRVAASAQSIAQLLPPLKLAQFTTLFTAPVYARVACSPTSENWTLAMSEIQGVGITFVQERSQLKSSSKTATFVAKDLLAFSPDCRSIIYNSGLRDGPLGVIYPQDFTSYMSITKLSSILTLIGENEQDVVVTNCDNGTIPGHIASLMKGKGKVLVFGVAPVNIRTIESNLSAVYINNVQLIPVSFVHVNPTDDMFSNVGLVFCNPPCSLTSVLHPVDFIMQEGDQYMAQVFKTQQVHLSTIIQEQKQHLCHSLKFEQAMYIVYFTRSNLEMENREMVYTIMSSHTAEADNTDIDHQGFEIEFSTGLEDKGFLSLLKKAPPKPSAAASDIITQAILNGVLSADEVLCSEYAIAQAKKKRKPKKRIFSLHEGIPMTFAAQQKVVAKKTTSTEKSRPFIM